MMLGLYTKLSENVARVWDALAVGTPAIRGIEDRPFVGSILNRYYADVSSFQFALEDDIMHHFVSWRRCGAPTFRLTHGLASGLLLTDPARLPWSEVRLPFPSFVISLPPGVIFFDDFDGSMIEATFVTINVFSVPMTREEGEAVFDAIDDSRTLPVVIERIRSMRSGPQLMIRVFSDGDKAKLYYMAPVPTDPATTVQEVFGFENDDGMLTSRDHAANRAVGRIIVGLSQYLTTHDEGGDPTWTPRAKPQGRAHGGHAWDVGRAVKLSREVREAAASYTREPGSEAWKVSSRHVVRGHMHGYWHGPRNDPSRREKRLQWIAPFWRGPTDGPVVQRLYDAEE